MSFAPPAAVLSFAASDPTGGAGLQADLLTIAALGCHPLSVVTALTVQDTRGVARVMAIEPPWTGELARLGLHARLGDCSALGAGPRAGGSRARSAALHLGSARRRLQTGRRAVPAEPLLPAVKLRGLYAVTPEGGDVERKVRLALEG